MVDKGRSKKQIIGQVRLHVHRGIKCTLMRSLQSASTSEDMSIVGELENLCFMYSNTPVH